MTTLETLYAGLDQSPDDWEARAVLADWFEEAGRQAVADAVRWMVARRKRPYRSTSGAYHWFNAGRVTTASDPESDLPDAVYQLLQGKEGLELIFRDYDNLRQAEEDFYIAWQKAVNRGWIRKA
jgi:uncharacterized protein (TIGR02996 family)